MPRSSFVWIGVIVLLLGLGFVTVSVFLGINEGRFRSDGVVTEAIVVEKHLESSDDDTDYVVTYRFTPPDGFEVFGSHDIDEDAWQRLDPGDRISVEYVRDDPGLNRPVGAGGLVGPVILAVIGGLGAPIGLTLALIGVRRVLRHRQILREGVAAEATVIGHQATSYRVNRQHQWIVVYRYSDRMGGEHIGRSDHMPMHRAMQWPPGSPVQIRYDRLRPDESAWVG